MIINTKVLLALAMTAYIATWGYIVSIANIMMINTTYEEPVKTVLVVAQEVKETENETMTFVATAYCSCAKCCGKNRRP